MGRAVNQVIIGEWEDSQDVMPYAMLPCMSTGLWFAHPTRPASALLRDILYRLETKPEQWEQVTANEVSVSIPLQPDLLMGDHECRICKQVCQAARFWPSGAPCLPAIAWLVHTAKEGKAASCCPSAPARCPYWGLASISRASAGLRV